MPRYYVSKDLEQRALAQLNRLFLDADGEPVFVVDVLYVTQGFWTRPVPTRPLLERLGAVRCPGVGYWRLPLEGAA